MLDCLGRVPLYQDVDDGILLTFTQFNSSPMISRYRICHICRILPRSAFLFSRRPSVQLTSFPSALLNTAGRFTFTTQFAFISVRSEVGLSLSRSFRETDLEQRDLLSIARSHAELFDVYFSPCLLITVGERREEGGGAIISLSQQLLVNRFSANSGVFR